MHKGIHTPTSQNQTKMKGGRGQTTIRQQHSSRRMVHSPAKMSKGGKMKGSY